MDKKKEFFNKKFVYVVVGASNNPSKYGYKIFKALVEANFKVFPVNPIENKILGFKCYKTLSEIHEEIDVVNFVVPANVTLKVLEEVEALGIEKVWFQHGSFNEDALVFCRQNKIGYINDACLLETVTGNKDN